MKPYFGNNKKILVAPLNWGLGHATRCIPIINALINKGFQPIVASDGDALQLLQLEFPELKYYELPSYNIQYTKNGNLLKYSMIFNSGNVVKAVKKEKEIVEEIVKKENIIGIISDNRFGVRSKKVPSVYITHQINVLSGNTTFLSSKIHQNIIAKFDYCWIADYKEEDNLAGKLSHSLNNKLNVKYIGPLSRFDKNITSKEEITKIKKYDVMVLLSGPEPQRGLLEIKLLNAFKTFSKKVLFVRGIISEKEKPTKAISIKKENIEVVNFMFQDELKQAILESKIIISRSGYSTIMDLNKLGAKAFFIPTPGQFEQEYLANYLNGKNIAPFSKQKDFNLKMLENIQNYVGFAHKKTSKAIEDQFPFDVFY